MKATVWVDPMCPWAWATAQWMTEVELVRDVQVDWQIMSLGVLNERNDIAPEHAKRIAHTWRPVRVLHAAAQQLGGQVTLPLYTAIGTRLHLGKRRDMDEILAESLAELGLDPKLAEAADSVEYDGLVRASHQAAIDISGAGVGTPVIAIDDLDGDPVGFFGPIMTPIPRGEAAGQFWDGFVLVAQVPGVVEIKRTRLSGPSLD